MQLTRYGEVALPPGAVVDGDVVEPDAVADGLRELWKVAGLRRRDVAVGLASQRVTVRQLELPELPEPELADAVALQAQDQLSIPPDQAVLDHVVVGSSPVGEERRNVRVLLVAAEREMVERLLTAVTAAKLRPVLVDLDAFALLRSVASGSGLPDEAELIVDVGASVTKIAVHCGGRPLFVRMVRLGGEAVTRNIQEVLELPWEEAEASKLDASRSLNSGAALDPDDERGRLLSNSVNQVIREVRHSLDFFGGQQEVDLKRVVLSGGASLTPNLGEQLGAALDLPVEPGDPFRSMEGPLPTEKLRSDTARFLAVPVGLALGLVS